PTLEFNRILEMKSIQKRAMVERHRRGEIAGGDRGLELTSIARDDRRIERQRCRADDDLIGPELTSKGIHGLLERMTRALLVALGPEMEEELVAAEAGWPRGRQDREQREPAALGRRPRQWRAVLGQSQPAKSRQSKQTDLESGGGIEP